MNNRRPRMPFRFSTKLATRHARLHRLKALGLTPAGDKATQRSLAAEAVASHPITRIPQGHRRYPKPSQFE
jgi:hypothetical protein